MTELFGTDGIRGMANRYPMTADCSFVKKTVYQRDELSSHNGLAIFFAVVFGLSTLAIGGYTYKLMKDPMNISLLDFFAISIERNSVKESDGLETKSPIPTSYLTFASSKNCTNFSFVN